MATLGVAAALTVFGLGACGGSSSSDSTSTVGRYVAEKNLAHYKPGSPQRTTMEWWKAVQFGNAGVVHSYYAPGVAPDPSDLKRELSATASQFVGVPSFNSADVRGSKATLYLFLGRPGSSAPPRPLSLNLVKTGGQWRLADNVLLEQQVARVAKVLRERSES